MRNILLLLMCGLILPPLLACNRSTKQDKPELRVTEATAPTPSVCALPGEPEVLDSEPETGSVLLRWEGLVQHAWSTTSSPDSDAFASYRARIEDADAALRVPVADPPEPETDFMREVWRREDLNIAAANSGEAGTLRKAHCFEKLFYAFQAERYDAITQPTEFVVAQVVKETEQGLMTRVYFGSSKNMFPSKRFYPFAAAAKDISEGWRFEVFLHNHPPQRLGEKPALGVPAPSTNDVMLARSLAEGEGLRRVLVTNGFYTIDIPTELLDRYQIPPAREQ